MKSSIYSNSKDVFLDTVNPKDYVQLDRVSTIYQSLKNSVKKPLKMILLYGKPGTGKSMFLSKLYQDLSKTQEIHFYQTPIVDESEFYRVLAHDLYGFNEEKELNFTQMMKIIQTKESEEVPLILLDEAQLYSDPLMEKIRLLSDTRKVKFVIALHKTQTEDLIAKEHFQTRIWESIELKNASLAEIKIYIQKKLMKANCFDTANMFHNNSVKLIYNLTNGNYRDTNKLLYSVFEIYDHYYNNNMSKISMDKVSNKIIEMSAIHTGLIDA
ncbi:AAA family ATPase [Sulfurimonas sp.]|uniref:AAA family ATPase n=1 Tax=Sulfurimonas sp. TaxID=2022749 RepID=UPI003569A218